MREIRTEIEIAASPGKVWSILTNINNWSEWSPIINQANGTAALGEKLSITMCGDNDKDGPKFTPSIIELEESKNFRWRTKMLGGLLFTNDKVFELEATNVGTRLVHKELFSGIMAKLFWSKLDNFVPSMLSSMNKALKEVAEKE